MSALDPDRGLDRDPLETTAMPGRYSALIGIVVPLAAGVLGSVIVSSPFLKDAVTLLPSTATGRLPPLTIGRGGGPPLFLKHQRCQYARTRFQ